MGMSDRLSTLEADFALIERALSDAKEFVHIGNSLGNEWSDKRMNDALEALKRIKEEMERR